MTIPKMLVLACALFLSTAAPLLSEDATSQAPALEAIRADLDALRFEKALQAIDDLLASSSIPEATRIEALTLRASAHVATGDLDRAEKDYRDVLALQPSWTPDRSLTPKKALARFEKVRAATVGEARLELRPKDARLTVDGKDVTVQPDGILPLLLGERSIHAERKGFDPADVKVQIAPGAAAPVQIALVPNSRTVILRTDPPQVTVRIDEKPVGETARAAGAAESQPGEIVVDEVPLGEHIFELSKTCYRSVRVRVLVTVDLVDPSPLLLEPTILAISRSHVVLEGGAPGAEVLVDGVRVGRLPVESLEVCSGERKLEIRAQGRVLWGELLTIPEGEESRISVAPRPNVVLVGAEPWPSDLRPLTDAWTSAPGPDAPQGADLSTREGWERLELPPGTDLAVGTLPATSPGGEERAYLYSPILKRLYPLASPIAPEARPVFHRTTLGARLVDSEVGGVARVVDVLPGSAAAAAGIVKGDRVLKVAGAAVQDSRAAMAAIVGQPAGATVPLEVASAAGASRSVSITAGTSPWIRDGSAEDVSSAILAAWASVDAAVSPVDGPAALASLGRLLSSAGQHARAAETLRRVRFGDRPGVSDGTASYELGRELAILGQEKEAREAFERAGRTAATAITDDGPEIKGAAADHLVDLGLARP